MSFINISKKSKYSEYKSAKIICPYCRDTTVNLKWRGVNSQGRKEFTDIDTDSLHLCKRKAPVVVKKELWKGGHAYFFNKIVIHEDDTPEQKGAKMAEQDKLRYIPSPEDIRNWSNKELMEKYRKEYEIWGKHDFNTVKKKWKISK